MENLTQEEVEQVTDEEEDGREEHDDEGLEILTHGIDDATDIFLSFFSLSKSYPS